mgnify:CR=1 FL=1
MNRIPVITGYVRRATGRILHVGCAGADDIRKSPLWLHGHVVRAAEERRTVASGPVVGVDLDRDRILEMQRLGYHAEVCDVMGLADRFPAGEFSLIIAGEIIEHLSNQKGFLRACETECHDRI